MIIEDHMLHELLFCIPETGDLFWRHRERIWFATTRAFNTWNSRYANRPALNIMNLHGYYVGYIYGKMYQKHRVIWFMKYGYWADEIDHDDGVRHNNQISNLRDVTKSQNQKNKKLQINNTSGVMGVGFHKATGKYRAYLKHHGRQISLGYYDTFDEAVIARRNGEISYEFNKNHGKIA